MLQHLLAWLLLALVGVGNGVLRVATYGRVLPEPAAHQVSTLTGIVLTGVLVFFLHRRWPLPSAAHAWGVGLCWLALTIAFEFGFGHYVAGHSWEHLLNDYNLSEGRVWSLFLLWVFIMPRVLYGVGRRLAYGRSLVD